MASRSRLLDALAVALRAIPDWRPGEHLLVAVSGGPDSTALLAGLTRLAPRFGHRVTAAHVAHGLRGAESDRDRDAVTALAARLGVPLVVLPGAVAPGANLEARARRARYRALRAARADRDATRIVTGHTRDDQVETVLLRLLRGARGGALGGIAPVRGALLRPLLDATRADVRRFLADADLPAALDRSNADLAHTRNRVRHLLVPLLEQEFTPRLGERLAGLAERWRDEAAWLTAQADARRAVLADADGLRIAVADEPAALRRLIVAAWVAVEGGRAGPRDVERLVALAASARPGRHHLAAGGIVTSDGRRLTRTDGTRRAGGRFEQSIAFGAAVEGPDARWCLTLGAPRARRDPEMLPDGLGRALFDADVLPGPLVVRSPAPGDRIHIPGVGTRKLQDLLVDAKVPRADRWRTPVLVAAAEVVWVGGLARGSTARLGPHTRRVVDARLDAAR